ncbi:MAG: relaxase/mobilization nuclease domain-containing protein, partial [Bradyrhizobium sp.]
CYHASINWHPEEQPTPEIMQEIARRTLDLAGLGAHQALVMGHGDKPHRHCHLMINRVHPETGRAWSTSHDYRRFDRIMRELADAYGFQYVPPHSFHPELTDQQPKAPGSAAIHAARRGARTDRPQWPRAASRAYGERLSEALDLATSWDDLEQFLAADGLILEPKGQGLVIGDADSYSKLSALGLAISAKGLAGRFRRAADRRRLRRRYTREDVADLTARLRPCLVGASSWDMVTSTLAIMGLRLDRTSGRLVVSDGRREIALAAVSGVPTRELSARFQQSWANYDRTRERETLSRPTRRIRLPAVPRSKLPPPRMPPRARRAPPWLQARSRTIWARRHALSVDAIDIAKAIGTQTDVRHALAEARSIRKARLSKAPLMVQLLEELKDTLRASTALRSKPKVRPPRPEPRGRGTDAAKRRRSSGGR